MEGLIDFRMHNVTTLACSLEVLNTPRTAIEAGDSNMIESWVEFLCSYRIQLREFGRTSRGRVKACKAKASSLTADADWIIRPEGVPSYLSPTWTLHTFTSKCPVRCADISLRAMLAVHAATREV